MTSSDTTAKSSGKTPISLDLPSPNILGRDQHCISRKNISSACLKVLYTLNDAGYQAYIVGGGVRDLLLGLHPKDFDVATDATPEQVKAEFRHARIIGRRFRIVHVTLGREIIEVSTFRATNTDSTEIQGDKLARKVRHLESAHSNNGMILRDNVYGTLEEDVMRRDFTVNALYYTVRQFQIHDYINGISDLEKRQLRMIGDPEVRYKEDPVRILRAIRLATKLDFTIEPGTAAPMKPLAYTLESIPSARLFDEILKLFFAGHARRTYLMLKEHHVFQYLFPETARELEQNNPVNENLLLNAFTSTDNRIRELKSVTPAFLLAAILWPAMQVRYRKNLSHKMPPMVAMHHAAQDTISAQVSRISIPKRFSIPMREIWEFQLRLPKKRRAHQLVTQKRFRAAYDFILLREQSGEDLEGLGQWWTDFQAADKTQRDGMVPTNTKGRRHSKSSRRRVKSSSVNNQR